MPPPETYPSPPLLELLIHFNFLGPSSCLHIRSDPTKITQRSATPHIRLLGPSTPTLVQTRQQRHKPLRKFESQHPTQRVDPNLSANRKKDYLKTLDISTPPQHCTSQKRASTPTHQRPHKHGLQTDNLLRPLPFQMAHLYALISFSRRNSKYEQIHLLLPRLTPTITKQNINPSMRGVTLNHPQLSGSPRELPNSQIQDLQQSSMKPKVYQLSYPTHKLFAIWHIG